MYYERVCAIDTECYSCTKTIAPYHNHTTPMLHHHKPGIPPQVCDAFKAHAHPDVHLACAKLLAISADHAPLHAQLLDSDAPSLLCKLVASYAAAEHTVHVAMTDTDTTDLSDSAPSQNYVSHAEEKPARDVCKRTDRQQPSTMGASTWLDAFLLQPLVPGDAHTRHCIEQGSTEAAPPTLAAAAAQQKRAIARDGALTAAVALMVALRDTDIADTLCALGYAKHLHALLCATADPPLHVVALQSLASMIAAAPPDAAQQLLAHHGLPTLLHLAQHGTGHCWGLDVCAGAVECLALLAGHPHRGVATAVDAMLPQVVRALQGCMRSRDTGCQAAALAVLAAVASRSCTAPALYKVCVLWVIRVALNALLL